MDLAGHRKITKTAVDEYIAENGLKTNSFQHRQLRDLTESIADFAVERDILDVVSLGHWSNFAQHHHFMRRFDGQSPHAAWKAACDWINENAVKHARSALQDRRRWGFKYLGYAAHAIEDSFAGGHVQRLPAGGPLLPGGITHVKMYAGHEKHNHTAMDKAWKTKTGALSLQGKLAKNAVKALIYLIFANVAKAQKAKSKTITSLDGWVTYRDKWLKASSQLSKERDGAYDLVDDFYTGIVWGNTNTATNFDEKGLADAIFDKLHVKTNKVRAVFERLDEYHTADSDDVALHYVNRLRKSPSGKVTKAVVADSKLVDILIKVMDEGWTSGDEKKCIKFLKDQSGR